MQEFFQSDTWRNQVAGDEVIYRAANASLDLTIERLGRTRFETNLQRFRQAMEAVQEHCGNSPMPCSPGGVRNKQPPCLWNDSGCGNACIDEVAKKLGLLPTN